MAWTATALGKRKENGNSVVTIRFDDGAGLTFDREIGGTSLSTSLPPLLGRIIAELNARDVDHPSVPASGAVTPVAPTPDDPVLDTFKRRWSRLLKLKALGSAAPAIVTMQTTLQGQVETALVTNPTWIDEAR